MLSAPLLLILAPVPVAPPPVQAEEPPPRVAVTASGLRVQCVGEPEPGAREVKTPYGVLHLPQDPVARVEDASAARRALETLAGAPGSRGLWLERAAASGLLEDLVRGCDRLLAEDPGDPAVYETLEAWGRRLDPVPPRIQEARARLDWLWRRVRQAESAAAGTLAAARLLAEATPSLQADPDRALSIADIRRGLRSRKPHVRRAAARMAAWERSYDLLLPLLDRSIDEPLEAVRDAAAWAVARAHRHEARQYWTLVLAQGPPAWRVAAARNLGRYGGQRAIHALAHVLAAWEHRVGDRIPFVRTDVLVVADRRTDLPFRNVGNTAFVGEILDQRSVLKVTVLEEETLQEVLAALEALAGEETGRDPAAWLTWYRKNAARLP